MRSVLSLVITLLLAQLASARHQQERRHDDFYSTTNTIYELDPSNFNDVVLKTNHTSVVEFYAPWCGYCVKFENEFKKASRAAGDFTNFGAVNCDQEYNKPLCNQYQITGFPSVLVFRPPKISLNESNDKKKHATETYSGERAAAPLVEFLKGRVKNYTKRIGLQKLTAWLTPSSKNRILLFTDKNSLSPVYKSLSIDFLENLEFGYFHVRDDDMKMKVIETVSNSKLTEDNFKLPLLLAVEKETNEITIYDEDSMSKENLTKFVAKFGEPSEGILSKRGRILKTIKSGLHKNFKEYMKKNKKSKKESQKKDEL